MYSFFVRIANKIMLQAELIYQELLCTSSRDNLALFKKSNAGCAPLSIN